MNQGTAAIPIRTVFDSMKEQLVCQNQRIEQLEAENKAQRRRIDRALAANKRNLMHGFNAVPSTRLNPTSKSEVVLSTESIAMEKDAQDKNINAPRQKGGAPGRVTRYLNSVSNEVMIRMPGAKRGRTNENGDRIGGSAANEKNLLAKVKRFWGGGLISTTDLARSMEISDVATEVHVRTSNKKGGNRRSWPADKPVNVFGDLARDTLQHGVLAANMALDKDVVEIFSSADMLALSFDMSTFGINSMQAVHFTGIKIVENGRDAAGNLRMKLEIRSGFLNALPVENKGTVERKDQDGKQISTFAPAKASRTLIMSGVAGPTLSHPCAIVGVDGGGEATGGSSKTDKQSHSGVGSYLRECFITRKAWGEAVQGHEPIVAKLDDFFGESDESRKLREERPAPRILSSNGSVLTRDGSKVSMIKNPLVYFALVLGGVPRSRYCNKHRANLFFLYVMKVMIEFIKDLMSAVLFFRNVWVLMKIKPAVLAIFDCPGTARYQYHIDAATKIPPWILEGVRTRLLKTAFTMFKELAPTRWGTVQEGAVELNNRRPELVAAMSIGLGTATDQARLNTVEAIFSREGFRDLQMIVFSEKEGKNFYRMNDPAFLWGLMLMKFFQVTVWGPIMAASSHNKECSTRSMGGLGSVLRNILDFLELRLFVHVRNVLQKPNPTGDRKVLRANKCRSLWNKWLKERMMKGEAAGVLVEGSPDKPYRRTVRYQLAHRGVPTSEFKQGFVMLNLHLEKQRTVSKLPHKEESGMKHTYGRFHTQEMDTIISETMDKICELACLEPGDGRNFLPKGLREYVKSPQITYWDRKRAMVESLQVIVRMTINGILLYHDRELYDPHGFLAGAIDVEAIPTVETRTKKKDEFFVSTHEGRANGRIAYLLAEELERYYEPQMGQGETLGDYLSGPFGELFRKPDLRRQLALFAKGEDVRLPLHINENRGINGLELDIKNKIHGTRLPIDAFPSLAKMVWLANADTTNQSRVEGGFSLVSGKWRALMRNVRAPWLAAINRKKTAKNAGLLERVETDDFLATFRQTRQFWCVNLEEMKKLYYLDLAAGAHRDRTKRLDELPKRVLKGGAFKKKSNIAEPSRKDKGRKPLAPASRQGGAKDNKRYRHSSGSEFDDTDGEPEESHCEEDDEESEAQDVDVPELNLDSPDSDDASSSPALRSRRQQSDRPDSEDMEPKAPAPAADSERSDRNDAAGNDDDVEGFDLDAIEASADSGDLEPKAPAPAADSERTGDDDDVAGFDLNAIEAGMSKTDREKMDTLRKLFDRDVDSDVSECENEPESGGTASAPVHYAGDRAKWNAIKEGGLRYTTEFTKNLLNFEKWVDGAVTKNGSVLATKEGRKLLPSVTVRRSDGTIIPVRPFDGHMLFLIAEPTGPELVCVTQISETGGAVVVSFLRVLDTLRAYESCDGEEDLVEAVQSENRYCAPSKRLGKKSLKSLLDMSRGKLLHHWGDVRWETAASNIAGLVGWLPESLAEDPSSKSRVVAEMKAKGVQIKSPTDLDWVIIGEPFSDQNPYAKRAETSDSAEFDAGCSRQAGRRPKKVAAKSTTAASGILPTLPACRYC